jgi:hypothetical protein
MKLINLTQGKVALVDDEDYGWLSQYRWTHNSKYAARSVKFNGKRAYMYMHREIMGLTIDDPREVDHRYNTGKEDYGLDNRRENLRICNTSQNQSNAIIRKDNKTGYKGVSWHKPLKKWYAQIKYKRISYYLGYFDNIIDAAKAYDKRAWELSGEFAFLNFPEDYL